MGTDACTYVIWQWQWNSFSYRKLTGRRQNATNLSPDKWNFIIEKNVTVKLMQTYVFQRVVSFKSRFYSGFPVKVGVQSCIQFFPVQSNRSCTKKNKKENKKVAEFVLWKETICKYPAFWLVYCRNPASKYLPDSWTFVVHFKANVFFNSRVFPYLEEIARFVL